MYKMYKKYKPVAETLDLVWRYDTRIFGDKWEDWIPYVLLPALFKVRKLN
ncbi:hypothetical protein ACFLTJ_02175 [Chloroflexota bacterium]